MEHLEKITLNKVGVQQENMNQLSSPQSVLKAAGLFADDEEAMLAHIEAIYAERQRQREDAERQIEIAESR
jgi:hypothetical protein